MRRRLALLAVLWGCSTGRLTAETVTVAAAANLTFALETLREAFAAEHPEISVVFVTGATGNLVAQIRHGAPFDVFLAADTASPRELAAGGHAAVATLVVFARGRLVWWTTRAGPATEVRSALDAIGVKRIALAQPAHAPYGAAARDALQHLGRWDELQPRLVIAESISQTVQFIDSGNADGGFVALSAVRSPRLQDRGHWLLVPAAWHQPLDQGAILTLRGATRPAAHAFLDWMQGDTAQTVLQHFGYDRLDPPSTDETRP